MNPHQPNNNNTEKNMIPANWLEAFNKHLITYFGINHKDAGATDEELLRYTDLEPKKAALVYGEDYDIERIDR